jgi:hypothetical protein
VVTQDRRPTLLLGNSRLAYHLRTRPDTLIEAIVLPIADADAVASIQALEAVVAPLPSERAKAVHALLDKGLGLSQLVQCVPGLRSVSMASRWAAIADADPYVLSCLDNGLLAFSHAAQLVPLPRNEQRQWAERCVAGGWSHAHLVAKLRARREHSQAANHVDVQAYAQALQDRLGSKVELTWDASSSRTDVSLEWFTVEELQGLMELLGAAPPHDGPLPSRGRRLVIKLDSVEELDALTGHLFREDG